VKGIPQGIPTTPFVEEVSETLPPVQKINQTLHKQQLVKEFPESKFPLPSETTQFHVSTEEPEHPIPIHNPASPKLEPSTSTQADDLVRAIKKLGCCLEGSVSIIPVGEVKSQKTWLKMQRYGRRLYN
jgi:hypothetical protein